MLTCWFSHQSLGSGDVCHHSGVHYQHFNFGAPEQPGQIIQNLA